VFFLAINFTLIPPYWLVPGTDQNSFRI